MPRPGTENHTRTGRTTSVRITLRTVHLSTLYTAAEHRSFRPITSSKLIRLSAFALPFANDNIKIAPPRHARSIRRANGKLAHPLSAQMGKRNAIITDWEEKTASC